MIRTALPTAADFHKAIVNFIAADDKTGCEEYINTILRNNGRPRIRGHRDEESEQNVALFLLTWVVETEKSIYKMAKHMTGRPKLSRTHQYIYDELCKWNGVTELPDYSGSFALASLTFRPLNISYK